MTSIRLENTKNGWFNNFLYWKKKQNRSLKKVTCHCRKTNQLAKSDETVQGTLNSNNKDEENIPIANNVSTNDNQKEAQQCVKSPGKVFQSERRGCGLHVYFYIDNMRKSNYQRNKQIKNKRGANCLEGVKVDQNNTKEMVYRDNVGITLVKTVKTSHSFSSVKSIEKKTRRIISFKKSYGELTSNTYNLKGMPFSSPKTAIYNLKSFHDNYSDKELDVKQTNVFDSNLTSSQKEKCEIGSDKNSSNENQLNTTAENETKKKEIGNNLETHNETKLIGSWIHSKEIPENILTNNVYEESMAKIQVKYIKPIIEVKECPKDTEHRFINVKKSLLERPKKSNTSCIITGSKEESYFKKLKAGHKNPSMESSILRKKQNGTNVSLESHESLVKKIKCESTHEFQRVKISPPNYIKNKTDSRTVNPKILNDPDEIEIFKEYERFQNGGKLQKNSPRMSRKSTFTNTSADSQYLDIYLPDIMSKINEYERFQNGGKLQKNSARKSRKSTFMNTSADRQYLDIYLPEIMSKINNIEDKITELEKICEDKGKSVTNIKNIMGISYKKPIQLHNRSKSSDKSSLTTYSKDKGNKTIKIKTSDEEICLNYTPKIVSNTKKIRNRGGSKQLVYHNTCEIDAHNITTKSLSTSGSKNSKTIQQHPQPTQVANKKDVFSDKWRRISEELKI